jgi:hypothetical protein
MIALRSRPMPRSTAPPVAPMLHVRIARAVADGALAFHAAGVAKGLPRDHAIIVRELSEPASDLDIAICQDIADGIGAVPCMMMRCPREDLADFLAMSGPDAAALLESQYRPGSVVLVVTTAGNGVTLFILLD